MREFLKKIVMCTAFCAWLLASGLLADELEIVIKGVGEPMLGNVRNMVEPFHLVGTARLSRRRLDALSEDSEQGARLALRPFGFYHPLVTTRTEQTGERSWRLHIEIDPGPPVVVADLKISLTGPGADLSELEQWRSAWPLVPGKRLVQPDWDRLLGEALDTAASRGYLLAEFTTRSMQVDLDRNEAALELLLDTGEQAVMGEVRFHQDTVKPHVVNRLPRFAVGDPYDAWIMERFHIDIWRTGYFGNIEVVEDRHLDASPPVVDLDVTTERRKPNTYQGTIGIGSDTGPRVKFSWTRHLISGNGDSFSLGTGWQDHNDEFFLRGGYRIPRPVESRQFWVADVLLKRENEDLRVSSDSSSDDLFSLGNANIDDYSVKIGRLKVYDKKRGYRQLFETMYAQYLFENVNYRANPTDPPELRVLLGEGNDDAPLANQSSTLALGIEYEMPVIRGRGFNTTGMNHRAWAFHSSEAWGSDDEFTQIYLSSRFNLAISDRWKVLLRGELGYSDAEVHDIQAVIEQQPVELSVTALPNLYRFKAGGSSSVRGYGFERLSTNNIGSNNVVTASVELEMKVVENWSAAAFFDIGNAFNDWSKTDLRKGVGVGVRWYTIAGAVRVDVAKALDLKDEPWRIHFTIGTSLL